MTDFPPNLEDGEQWLPSDIYQEIISGNFESKDLAGSIPQVCGQEIGSFELGEESNGSSGNSGGTGVYHPKTTPNENKLKKGTGVFLQSLPSNKLITMHKKSKSGKDGQVIGKMFMAKKESSDRKELPEMYLPQEWNYELSV